MIAMKHILVATDFSEPSDEALRYGRELASRFDATLHVLHVAENILVTAFGAETYSAMAPGLQREIEDAARARLAEAVIDSDASGPQTRPVVMTSSSPAFAIVDYARDQKIDLIIMGTHGRGAIEQFLMGSVAERVVRLARCPVLTVKHPERDFVRTDALAVLATTEAT